MAAPSTLDLVSELAAASTLRKVREISSKVSERLAADNRALDSTIAFLFEKVVNSSKTPREFQSVVRDGSYDRWSSVFVDSDGASRLSLGIAYVQDHTEFDPELDVLVLGAFVDALKGRNLDIVVSDVCVNAEQHVRGGRR